ncbi:hypothetical protein [Micromonospora sp. KLBMP9576]|uniref:hypothetical protein n=1 Tax=Micromonospora sp. KLBMP9576 TaxID=3424769 RepID=UPI003D8B5248
MIESRQVPFLVEVAWFVIDDHHVKPCHWCHPDSWCPRFTAARARLLAWRLAGDPR